jgi:hypothetical protein
MQSPDRSPPAGSATVNGPVNTRSIRDGAGEKLSVGDGERVRLSEPRDSERLRLLVRLGQEAGQVLENLGDRLPSDAPAWQFLATTTASDEGWQNRDVVSSLRAAEAVVDLVDINKRWATRGLRKRAAGVIEAARAMELERLLESVEDEFKGSGDDRRAPYAVASLVAFRARCECAREREDDERPADLLTEMTDELQAQIERALEIGDGDPEAGVHPFLLYHLMRALVLAEYCAAQMPAAKAALATRLREVTERLLARTLLRTGSGAEGVALTFCAAALALSNPDDDRPHIEAALDAAAACQEESGCWAQGCNVGTMNDPDGGGQFEISTYEVALALAEAVLGITRSDRTGARPIPHSPLAALWRALAHVDFSRRKADGEAPPSEGWSARQIYGRPQVESLASANVLSLTVRFQQLLDVIARHEVFPTYEIEDPRTEFWPPWLEWETYRDNSEPDSENKILGYLDREVVLATAKAEVGRPYPWARAKQITVLLFGPPGTTKTTIVRAVAEGLDWPLITLGPGDFVQDGLEAVEARADRIFNDLHSLSRAVVLFDECDELFRAREPDKSSDQVRGIAAFVTASMLPKLQDLHDRGQVVLFILTNHFATMDSAIKRLGRVDHIIGIGPPDLAQRTVILQKAFEEELAGTGIEEEVIAGAIDEIAHVDKHFIRSELVRIATKTAGSLRGAEKLDEKTARAMARSELEKQTSVTVNDEKFKEFESQLVASLPHV